MATPKKRIYVVSDADQNVNLVRAATKAQAISHVVKNTFTANLASQDDLVKYARDVEVEDAGEESTE